MEPFRTYRQAIRIYGELCLSGDSWLVGPFPGDGVSEDISLRLVVVDSDVGVVGVASSGQRGVDAGVVGKAVD